MSRHLGLIAVCACIVVVPACGTPTRSSPPPFPPPTITSVEPRTALTSGGAYVRIDGTGFRDNATLIVGGVKVQNRSLGPPNTMYAITPSHAPGLVDITVTNDDGQSATLAGALTYQAIEDFDFSGSWEGRAFFQNEEMPFQLAIEHNHVVTFTCGTSGGVVLDPAPLLRSGNFAYTGANGLAIDGGIDTDFDGIPYLAGTINAPSCKGTSWYAYKK